ncbi:MAG: hypothetical protein IH863_09730 [Chloroflexi bacterium]|nr:hypothetical protein [Chloroflexota bacterium]
MLPIADVGGPGEPNDSIVQPTETGLAFAGQVTLNGRVGDGRFVETRGDVATVQGGTGGITPFGDQVAAIDGE